MRFQIRENGQFQLVIKVLQFSEELSSLLPNEYLY
jgi:hypothetical protein